MEQDIKIFSKINKALDGFKDFCKVQKEIIELNNASYAYLFVKEALENLENAPLKFSELKAIILQESTPLALQYQFAKLLKDHKIIMNNSVIIERLKNAKESHYHILAKSLTSTETEEEMSDITK